MSSSLLDLLAALRRSPTFEDAARHLLESSLATLAEALGASPFPRAGRLSRASLHLRSKSGYRSLVVVEPGDSDASVLAEEMIVPSATAFRLLEPHHAPLALDIVRGEIRIVGGELLVAADATGIDSDVFRSRREILRRNTTHALALPLRNPERHLTGMVFLEAQCLPAVPPSFVWTDRVTLLQGLADVASPYLAALPSERAPEPAPDRLLPVVGAKMKGVVRVLGSFASQRETLLLTGPSGAGKSRLAEWCHRHSGRSGPLEQVDLLAVPDEMQMAELFGWKKGAFTGALRDHEGYIARAEGGTLFLDEIDKLSLKAQAGLLNFLERREYRKLGSSGGPQRADVRVIAATNTDLWESVQHGRFREDLYYRVNVLPIQVPPLRERRDEIGDWARFMLRRFCEEIGGGALELSPAAGDVLSAYEWTGNLRQLDNVVHRAGALAAGERRDQDPAQTVVIEVEHVTRALDLERSDRGSNLLGALRSAAAVFAREANRLQQAGVQLNLDHADAFRGLVLSAGLDLLGEKEAVMRLFGKEALVQHRNHYKLLRKELKSVLDLCEVLQVEPDRGVSLAFESV